MSYAGLFDTGEGPLQAVREPLGIKGSVLAPDAQELAFGPTGALARRTAEKEPSQQESR